MNDDLRKIATAATPGPWRADGKGSVLTHGKSPRHPVAEFVMENDWPLIAACSPDQILALLDERDALLAVEKAARRSHYRMDPDSLLGSEAHVCGGCGAAWPCRDAVTLAHLDSIREGAR